MMGVEPMTPSLPRKCSTTELHRQTRAGNETRTRDPQRGRLMLYQLSYSRWLVERAGFEPTKTYVSRFTVCPSWPLWYLSSKPRCTEPMEGFEPPTR